MRKSIFILLFVFVVGCGRKVQPVVNPPISSADPEVVYQAGLDAFREATPEGYARSVEAFRNALRLEPSRCEYVLHLAESLFFLAQQQKINRTTGRNRAPRSSGIRSGLRSS